MGGHFPTDDRIRTKRYHLRPRHYRERLFAKRVSTKL
jgi:hypothetical protein